MELFIIEINLSVIFAADSILKQDNMFSPPNQGLNIIHLDTDKKKRI
jgi:hypothetical protein